MNKYVCLILIAIFSVACNNSTENKKEITVREQDGIKKFSKEEIKKLTEEGYKILEFIDPKTKDTIVMQQYFMAFLKKGQNRSQSKQGADSLQRLHLAHLKRMYDLGYADISGPFGDLGDIRGITIYSVPTIEMADSLANADPMVKAGRLEIEMHPWWAGKGLPLR